MANTFYSGSTILMAHILNKPKYMKKLVSILLVGLCHIGFAQQKGRIAYIDSDFIMSKMPEYEEANRELKKRTAEWEAVIERKKKEIKDLTSQKGQSKI